MIEDFLLRWTPVIVFVAVLVYLLDITVGRVLDKITRKNEAIRSFMINNAVQQLGENIAYNFGQSMMTLVELTKDLPS